MASYNKEIASPMRYPKKSRSPFYFRGLRGLLKTHRARVQALEARRARAVVLVEAREAAEAEVAPLSVSSGDLYQVDEAPQAEGATKRLSSSSRWLLKQRTFSKTVRNLLLRRCAETFPAALLSTSEDCVDIEEADEAEIASETALLSVSEHFCVAAEDVSWIYMEIPLWKIVVLAVVAIMFVYDVRDVEFQTVRGAVARFSTYTFQANATLALPEYASEPVSNKISIEAPRKTSKPASVERKTIKSTTSASNKTSTKTSKSASSKTSTAVSTSTGESSGFGWLKLFWPCQTSSQGSSTEIATITLKGEGSWSFLGLVAFAIFLL